MKLKKQKLQIDYPFLISLGVIVVFGLIMLASATAPTAFETYGDSEYLVKHQMLVGLLPGLILMLFFTFFDYRKLKKYAFWSLIVSIVLLVSVFIPGVGAEFGSARSWISIFGFSLQPSEIVKLTFLIYLATWLETRGHHKASHLTEGLVPFLAVLGVVALLMMLQPDLGTLTIIILMSLVVYFVGGAKISHIAGVGVLGMLFLLLMIKISPYRAARLTIFLHPELDPQGIGYHINQAFLAIGSGGFWGRGLGLSRQKFQYLPEVAGDSIFAIIAEELGFFFGALLVIGFLYFLYRGIRIAAQAPDAFGKLLVTGIISWLGIQAFVNIGAMVGLLPLTGVPLPFVSQGGTALAVALAACGIVLNVSKHTKLQ